MQQLIIFFTGQPHTIDDLVCERLLLREKGSGTRDILEQSLIARGMRISDFIHYTAVENMHTIIDLLKKDCGISFLYKIAVENELHSGVLKEISLMTLNARETLILSGKSSIFTDRYIYFCEEFI